MKWMEEGSKTRRIKKRKTREEEWEEEMDRKWERGG